MCAYSREPVPGVWWDLRWAAVCFPFCVHGENILLLHIRGTQWWAALVQHLIWLWKGLQVFLLYQQPW